MSTHVRSSISNLVLDAISSLAITCLRKRAGCFTLIECGCGELCSVSIPHGAVGLQCVVVIFPGHVLL